MSGLSCSSKLAKYLLFFFNVIFWICGAILLGVGIWVLADPNALTYLKIATIDHSDSLVRASAITLIVVGLVTFLTGFFGCCGAMRESPTMLCFYSFILVLILILQITAGILAAVYKNQITDILGRSMNKTVTERYGEKDQEGLTEAWDVMQKTFKCCGAIDGPSDWKNSAWATNNSAPVPLTCCVLNDAGAETPVPKNTSMCYSLARSDSPADGNGYLYTEGCKQSLLDWVVDHAGILIGIAFGIAVVEVLGVVLACCLRKNIKGTYEYV